MDNTFENTEIPQGISMAFAENIKAMYVFSSMNQIEQSKFLIGARGVSSKKEMQEYVDSLIPPNIT